MLGLVGGLVQTPAAGPDQVQTLVRSLPVSSLLAEARSPVPVLWQDVLWGEDRTVLRLAGLVHWDAGPCCAGRPPGLPLRCLHLRPVPGQVNACLMFLPYSTEVSGLIPGCG